jgi:A/G-specific adenine glycosylase
MCPAPTPPPAAALPAPLRARIRRRLLAWYDVHRRDLPWRRTRDPFAIWISETMLQQTRVETVIPYYERFLARFPDVQSLADAELEDVYAEWTGLGYYSRARNLHGAARTLADEHGGELPGDATGLRKLSGIGRYTAGAVASIAFGQREPVVDGNVVRVLARLLAVREDVGERIVMERFWRIATELARCARPGDLNQALMELGATLCTPRAPRCASCPLQRDCQAHHAGDAEALPIKARRARTRDIAAVAGWIVRRGRALAVQRAEGGLLGGLWELPGGDMADDPTPEAALHRCLRERLGLSVARATRVGEIEHLFTHRRLRVHVFRCEEPGGRIQRRDHAAHRWLSPTALGALPQGGPTRKALALLGEGDAEPHRRRLRRSAAAAGP